MGMTKFECEERHPPTMFAVSEITATYHESSEGR
jgi:hypothetical protein